VGWNVSPLPHLARSFRRSRYPLGGLPVGAEGSKSDREVSSACRRLRIGHRTIFTQRLVLLRVLTRPQQCRLRWPLGVEKDMGGRLHREPSYPDGHGYVPDLRGTRRLGSVDRAFCRRFITPPRVAPLDSAHSSAPPRTPRPWTHLHPARWGGHLLTMRVCLLHTPCNGGRIDATRDGDPGLRQSTPA
jgi:hypothetical protein